LIGLARDHEYDRLRVDSESTLREQERFSLSDSEFETQDDMHEAYQIEKPSRAEAQACWNQISGST